MTIIVSISNLKPSGAELYLFQIYTRFKPKSIFFNTQIFFSNLPIT